MRRIRVIGPGKKGDGCGNLEQKNHGPAFLPFILGDPNAKDGGRGVVGSLAPPPRPSPLNSPPTPYPRPAAGPQPLRPPAHSPRGSGPRSELSSIAWTPARGRRTAFARRLMKPRARAGVRSCERGVPAPSPRRRRGPLGRAVPGAAAGCRGPGATPLPAPAEAQAGAGAAPLRPLPGGWGLHAGRGREPAYWVAVGKLALEGQGVRLGEGGRLPGPDLVAPLALETESFPWKATWGATYQGSSKPLTRVPCLPAASLRFPQASGLMSPQDAMLIGRSVEHGAVLRMKASWKNPGCRVKWTPLEWDAIVRAREAAEFKRLWTPRAFPL
ncbi:uncharacterized protein [Sagmatias obliquidens]|uniref:uncharacterized protein n=1 Tax=Sagmatias obliquidens TaxID=3371155 RepID=UPI000F4439C3|nr:uncharacterized protein LOC113617975 [Lagenorhynchus obliquidens]